jgi:N-acetylglutamate synthase-like GNAT family acetyltransferase
MIGAAKQWVADRMPRWLAAPHFGKWKSGPAEIPHGWERQGCLDDGTALFIRPLRPEDETLYPEFLRNVTPEDLRLRFFVRVKEFTHDAIARFTHIDYARAMAFVALDQNTGRILGVARLHRLPDMRCAEFAILVRSDYKEHGVGWKLMQILIEYARRIGITAVVGDVLPENATMLQMCAELGFKIATNPADPSLRSVRLALQSR